MGPGSQVPRVSREAGVVRQVHKFAEAGANLNVLRNSDSCLRSSASGIRRCGLVCGLAVRQPFPPTEEVVLPGPIFSTRQKAFAFFAAHLERECDISRIGASRRTGGGTFATHGLSKAGDQLFSPGSAGAQGRLAAIFSKGWSDHCAAVAAWSRAFFASHPNASRFTAKKWRET